MPAKFPRLTGSGLIQISVCVQLGKGSDLPELKKRARSKTDFEFVQIAPEDFVLCTFHGVKTISFHVDMCTKDFFDGDPPPVEKSSLKSAEKMLNAALAVVRGKSANVALIGTMRSKTDALPKQGIIRATLQTEEETSSTVSMRLVGGKVAIKGTPFERLEWSMEGKEDFVDVRLFSKRKLKIADNYLESGVEFMKSGFNVLVVDQEGSHAGK